MASVIEGIRDGVRRTALADRTTPFIFDCWYVAGPASDFTRTLRARTILGRPLVLYRTVAGTPVALDDRCAHRSFPLSKSTLDGDTIVCGYHGMRYNRAGRCTEVPSLPHAPKGIGVRSYHIVERGPHVWIWMGEGRGDETLIPDVGHWIGNPAWPASQGYIHLKANYISLHENLLDLTHLTFLHKGFGTPEYAAAPFRVEIDEERGRFVLLRDVVPTRLPPVWAQPTGLEDVDAARIVRSEFYAPSLHVVQVGFYAVNLAEAERPDQQIRTAHFVTPETKIVNALFSASCAQFRAGRSGRHRFHALQPAGRVR